MLSALRGRTTRRLAVGLAWTLFAYIAFVTLAPVESRPQVGHPILERVFAYFMLGVAFAIGYQSRPLGVIAMMVVSALGLEAGQILVPGRHAHLADALEKLVGGLAGVEIVVLSLALDQRIDKLNRSAKVGPP